MSYDVIVVESDAANREVIEKLLEPIGVKCKFVSGPDELESLRFGSNLLLMGCYQESRAVVRRLRAKSVHIPIIALRKPDDDAMDEEIYEAGFDAVIREPYTPFRFQQIILTFLRQEKK
jgi:CheY-like chemotaxis protein